MGANSKIEWCHHTFNPWIGCTKVSDGCKNCYAEEMMDHRFGRAKWGDNGVRIRTSPQKWEEPFAWDKRAAAAGERHRVFCASLADVFEDRPELREWRYNLFRIIDLTPNLDWLLLTKRPENVIKSLRGVDGYQKALQIRDNVWIGTSVENQEQADKRIPELLRIPAKVRFLSMEPLLGPVNLSLRWDRLEFVPGIHWVIVGGESGRNARPMHPDWARSIRDQCQAAGVPFLMKQWGEWFPANCDSESDEVRMPDGSLRRLMDEGGKQLIPWHGWSSSWADPLTCYTGSIRVGKHAAGRILDGRTWDEVPTP